MDQKPQDVLQNLSGSGELRQAGRHLARVFYHLRVRQIAGAAETAGDRPSNFEITGEVTVSQDEPMQAQVLNRMETGEMLILHLADGRQLEVHAAKSAGFSAAYQITGASPAGFRSP